MLTPRSNTEFSLWATDILTNGIAAACAELHIPIIAYSPLGRGFLTGEIRKPEDIPEGDFRKHMPRFQPGVFDQNLGLVTELEKLAKSKGCTPAQVRFFRIISFLFELIFRFSLGQLSM